MSGAPVPGNNVFSIEKKQALYASGMEEAVIDLVVIQWIVQKVKRDLRRSRFRDLQYQYDSDEAQSA